MNLHESFNLDDMKALYDGITFFKNRDIDQALTSVKKVLQKLDESKAKTNKPSEARSKLSKIDDFRLSLNSILSKLKSAMESVEKIDSSNVLLLYNCALMLYTTKHHFQSLKLLDKIQYDFQLWDNFTKIQYAYLRLENFIATQSPLTSSFLESEMFQDIVKNCCETDKTNIDMFRLRSAIVQRDSQTMFELLEKLKSANIPYFKFFEANCLFACRRIRDSLQSLNSLGYSYDFTTEKNGAFFWNNLGILHFHLHKHNSGLMYLNRCFGSSGTAVDISGGANSKKGVRHSITSNLTKDFSLTRPYEIIYNFGIQLLFANKPIDAFDLLLEVVTVFPKNPRLWLRLAECCIKAYRNDSNSGISSGESTKPSTKYVQSIIGNGPFKRIVLGSNMKECKRPLEEVAAMPTPTLEFGSLCIRTGLFLLPRRMNNDSQNVIDWYNQQCLFVNPGGCIRGTDILQLESSLFLSGAYISLALNNHVETIKLCECLLQQPQLPPYYHYLGRMYLGEALAMTNNLASALCQLNSNTITSTSLYSESLLSNNNATELFAPTTILNIEKAKSLMLYNAAVANSIWHKHPNAEQCLNEAAMLDPNLRKSSPYTHFRLYLELSQGRSKQCLNILRDLFSQIPIVCDG